MELNPDTQRQVSASLTRMSTRSAFFAALALFAQYEATGEIATAATDGRVVYVNPSFWGGLTSAEQDGLLLHEVLHAALQHLPRRGGRDAKLWNIAADIVINGMLLREGYSLPEGGLRDQALEHLGAEEVYDILLRRQEYSQQPQAVQEDLLDRRPADAAPSASAAEGENGEPGANSDGYWRNALEQAQIVAQSSVAGKMPAGLQRELGSVKHAKIDWRSYLWRYLTTTPTDFADFDRRFVGSGTYLETLSGESLNILLCIDTSGSVDQAQLQTLVAEVTGILRAYRHLRCELYYADTELHGPYLLRPGAAIPPPIGGGGTDFRPFFERIARHPFQWGRTVAIYLTDGYGTFPTGAPRCPVLWVVTPGGLRLEGFPFGETVRLTVSR